MNDHVTLTRRLAGATKRLFAGLTLILTVLGLVSVLPAATPPTKMSFQSFLTDSNGDPIDGNQTIRFDLYDASTGGSSVWNEEIVTTVNNGHFSVILGESTVLDASKFNGERYMELTVGGAGGTKLSPRLRLLTAPFAFVAESANGLSTTAGTDVLTLSGTTASFAGSANVQGDTTLGNAAADEVFINGGEIHLRANGHTSTKISVVNEGVTFRATGKSTGYWFQDNVRLGNGTSHSTIMTGPITAQHNLTVQGASIHDGTLWAKGGTTLGDANTDLVDILGKVKISRTGTANADKEMLQLKRSTTGNEASLRMNDEGDLVIRTHQNLYLEQAAIAQAELTVLGNTTLGDASSDTVLAKGTVTVAKDLIVHGDVTLGNSVDDTVTTIGDATVAGGTVGTGSSPDMNAAISADLSSIANWRSTDRKGIIESKHEDGSYIVFTHGGDLDQNLRIWMGANQANAAARATLNFSSGSWQTTSDRRLKKNIEEAPQGFLDKLESMPPTKFHTRVQRSDDKLNLGLIAQDVRQVFPEIVDEDSEGMLSLDYSRVGVVAVGAVRELHQQTDVRLSRLSDENRSLKAENDALKKQFSRLMSRLRALESKVK